MERRNEGNSTPRDQGDEATAQNNLLQQINSLIDSAVARNMINFERMIEDRVSHHHPETHNGGNQHTEGETSRRRSERVRFKDFKGSGATEFRGTETPIVASAWIANIEKVFTISRCWEEDKVMYAAAMFTNDALHWWNSRTNSLGEARIKTMAWSEFKGEFMQQFCPVDQQEKYEKEFVKLQQGNKTVTEYEAEFNRKSRFATALLSSEAVKVRRFVHGLRWEIKESVQMQNPTTMAEATRYARMREDILRAQDADSSPSRLPTFSHYPFYHETQSNAPRCDYCGRYHFGSCEGPSGINSPIICHHCGQPGHIAPHCPEKVFLTCYECGEPGHVRKNCPHFRRYDNTASASVPRHTTSDASDRPKRK